MSDVIDIDCPHCGNSGQVSAEQAKLAIQCCYCQQSFVVPAEDAKPLCGIDGWLIIPAIGMIGGPIWLALNIGIMLMLFDEKLPMKFSFSILLSVVTLAMAVYVAVQFFQRRRNLPKLIIGLMGVNILFSCFQAAIWLDPSAPVGSVVYGAIWIPYFLRSKRVQATFTK